MSCSKDELSLSTEFDKELEAFNDINKSTLSTSSPELQTKICSLIRQLEQTTVKVSQLMIFSDNEEYEELQTESIKMLLLPALLGFLSMKELGIPRLDSLRIASVYYKDFIKRCNDYGLTTAKAPGEREDYDEAQIEIKNPKAKSLDQLNAERMNKIERYKQKKILKEKLDELKGVITNCDDETLREYYLKLIEFYIHEVMDEFPLMEMEEKMHKRRGNDESTAKSQLTLDDVGEPKPLKPFLITKNEAQKKIYGVGYPSLPIYTVEEFYEQRVRDGIFPDNSKQNHAASVIENDPDAEAIAKEIAEEKDDPDARGSLMSRDEWRDNHRRGYGNTYNRS